MTLNDRTINDVRIISGADNIAEKRLFAYSGDEYAGSDAHVANGNAKFRVPGATNN